MLRLLHWRTSINSSTHTKLIATKANIILGRSEPKQRVYGIITARIKAWQSHSTSNTYIHTYSIMVVVAYASAGLMTESKAAAAAADDERRSATGVCVCAEVELHIRHTTLCWTGWTRRKELYTTRTQPPAISCVIAFGSWVKSHGRRNTTAGRFACNGPPFLSFPPLCFGSRSAKRCF